MNSDAKSFLLRLLNIASPTGFETEGQKAWLAYIRQHSDAVDQDHYGNAWARLAGRDESVRLLLTAHADEIGFMVQNITDDGYIYVTRIGGSDRAVARGKKIRILGDKGPVQGVIGITAIHLREKEEDRLPEIHELFIDIGAGSRQSVVDRGIRVGHPAVYSEAAEEWPGGRLVGRALDNRIGSFILTQVFANLKIAPESPPTSVFALNAVHEEIGGPGARMAAWRLEPTIAVVLDVTHATDSPGINRNRHGSIRLGSGPTVTHGTANHPLLVRRLIRLAQDLSIPIQHEASSRTTGTDTDVIYPTRGGIPSALISIPLRYMHSPVEMIDLPDVEKAVQLLTAFANALGDRGFLDPS